MGGTNDICCDGMPSEVLSTLFEMHAAVSASGARLLALTLPPIFGRGLPPAVVAAREAVNSGLRARWGQGAAGGGGGGGAAAAAAAAAAAGPPPEGSLLLDLDPVLPTGAEWGLLWDDELHLTAAGYRRVGQAVFHALAPQLAIGEACGGAGSQ
jgi:lysophospholipase L1-like esterase